MVFKNWKSNCVLIGISIVSVLLLIMALVATLKLPFLTKPGLLSWIVLLLLTLGASRFTVSVTSTDGLSQTRKSVADAFVFLAVMIYAIPPAETAGPATLLAAIVAFASSYGLATKREALFTTGIATISTFVSASCYGILVYVFAGTTNLGLEQGLPLNIFLVPLCVLAVLHYSLSTLATAAFLSLDAGKTSVMPSQESVVWTLTTHVAGAASAVLFYSSIRGAGIPFALLGLLITALIHLLYRFNEKRLNEVKRAEADQRRHIQELADIHMNTIESLAIAIDAKDQTTHGHVRRTQIYAMEMGKLFKVSESELQALFAGALLHDIGKLAVPEYILNKPGKLTEAEFAKMKIHPTVGGDILRRVNFPYPVEDIVRYHHEKWDGSGYPKGLKGEAIPLVARIISVVDFYDATRCDRPYRKGMTRDESLALLKSMANSAFDPRVVGIFVENVERFDALIDAEDIQEQVASDTMDADYGTTTAPDAGLASDILGSPHESSGFRSITEAQREVFALHEIAQTIGSSLNLNDTVALISNKLRAIVPFDTCIIFIVDEKSGKASAIHCAGEHAHFFNNRRMNVGDGITGWVIANARSMCNASPELDLVGVLEEVSKSYRGVLVSPLLREDGAFGAITLYSMSRTSYSTEHVRLLESVCQHASSALNNALTFEKTKASALTDPLTELPNARGFYMMIEQRLAEGQRMNRESLAVVSLDIDDFKALNDQYGHATGDRVLASVAGVIRSELRQMDILARYAGDEFVAIMPMASSQVAASVGERIRSAIESHKYSVRTAKTVQLGVSLGIACFPEDGETSEELLTAAARKMQQDKHGRKTVLNLAKTPVSVLETLT
ncbi:MAG TPA: diguanylate cyclase [Pyrinomonadaceae bacterium]|nr:diguanylate cyclase [Pyrinomonadaceae bacterium]